MHKILSEISLRMLIRIFRLTFSSVSWLPSFSSGVGGFVALGPSLSCRWFSFAIWLSLGVCLYLRLMGSFGVGGVDFLWDRWASFKDWLSGPGWEGGGRAGRVVAWPSPVPGRQCSGVSEPLLVLPEHLVWFRVVQS